MTDRKEVVVNKLNESRRHFLSVTTSLSPEQWQLPIYDEGSEWLIADILRHVADSERGMTALMVQIQAGGEGVPADFDLDRWNKRAVGKLEDKTPDELMSSMSESRAKLLAFIDTIEPDDWDKRGRHASLRIMSIEEVCHLIADHEAAHANEIAQAISA